MCKSAWRVMCVGVCSLHPDTWSSPPGWMIPSMPWWLVWARPCTCATSPPGPPPAARGGGGRVSFSWFLCLRWMSAPKFGLFRDASFWCSTTTELVFFGIRSLQPNTGLLPLHRSVVFFIPFLLNPVVAWGSYLLVFTVKRRTTKSGKGCDSDGKKAAGTRGTKRKRRVRRTKSRRKQVSTFC